MDPVTADVIKTAIPVVATLLAGIFGFAAGLITERRRRSWEDRHRFTDTKRMLYARTIASARRGLLVAQSPKVDAAALEGHLVELFDCMSEINLMAPKPIIDAVTDMVLATMAAETNAKKPISDAEVTELGRLIGMTTDAMRRDVGTAGSIGENVRAKPGTPSVPH